MMWFSKLFGPKWRIKAIKEIRKSTGHNWIGSIVITRDNIERLETFLFKKEPTASEVKKKAQMACNSRNGAGERDAFRIVDSEGKGLEILHGVWKDPITFEVKTRENLVK
jgi:hypothetical protein